MAGEADIDTRRAEPVASVPARETGEWRKDVLTAGTLGVLALALYIVPALFGRPISETPETRIGVVAREMILSGDYVVPTIAGEPRLNKPPLPYWLVAGAAKAVDTGEGPTQRVMTRAVEIPPPLMAALAVFIIALYGCVVFGRPAGALAGMLFAFCAMVADYTWKCYGDAALMCACAGMFCAAGWLLSTARPGFLCSLALGISLGLAILSKGHIPILLLLAPLLIEVMLARTFNLRKCLIFALALAVAAAIAAPWYASVMNLGAWTAMEKELHDAVSLTSHNKDDRWTFYIYRLASGMGPWTPLLLAGWLLYVLRVRTRAGEPPHLLIFPRLQLRFFTLAFAVGFIGFYAVPKQQEYYLLPILPPLALASGYVLSCFKSGGGIAEEKLAWTQVAIGVLGAAAIAALPAWPLDVVAETKVNEADIRAAVDMLGWPVSIPAGLAFLLAHLYFARQCVEGRLLRAGVMLSVLAYSGLLTWGIYYSAKKRRDIALAAEAPQMRADIEHIRAEAGKASREVRVYTTGKSEAYWEFYLELKHPALKLKDLAGEPSGKTGAEAPQRVLIASRNDLRQLHLEQYVPPGESTHLALPLPPEVDWPAAIQSALNAKSAAKSQD